MLSHRNCVCAANEIRRTSMYSATAGQARNAALQSTPSGIQLTCEADATLACCRVPQILSHSVLSRPALKCSGKRDVRLQQPQLD
jgi:hypothetical protein